MFDLCLIAVGGFLAALVVGAVVERALVLPEAVIEKLISHFGSLQKILAASAEDLRDVEGVGETRARAIREGLGLSQQAQRGIEQILSHREGIVLVTGPTGSGKTTTLYSTLKKVATPEVNLCTIEDPIEQIDSHFNQMQVQHNIGLDFASGIRTLMRQDPDIIMIGEIRDLETATIAINADKTVPLDNVVAVMRIARNLGARTTLLVDNKTE